MAGSILYEKLNLANSTLGETILRQVELIWIVALYLFDMAGG